LCPDRHEWPIPRRILFLDFDGLGSACIAVGLLRELERRWPNVRYTYPENALLRDPVLNARAGLSGLLRTTPALWRRCAPEDWPRLRDLVVTLELDTVVNFRNPDPADDDRYLRFMDWLDEQGVDVRHHDLYDLGDVNGLAVAERMRALLARAGLPVAPPTPGWLAGPTAGERHDGPVVGVFPSASMPSKRWPTRAWTAFVATLLACDDGATVDVLVGASDSELDDALDVLTGLSVGVADRVQLVPHSHLATLAERLQRMDVLVANDTGVAHLAAALGVPTVSIHLSTRAAVWGADPRPGRTVESLVGARCRCQRPQQGNCTRHYGACDAPCHHDVSVADVVRAVDDVVAGPGAIAKE
jgi:ADP-heptose:LPS heptosyltransferase